MSKLKVTQVNGRHATMAPRQVTASKKRAVSRAKQEAKLIEAATMLAIELHRDALKELERY